MLWLKIKNFLKWGLIDSIIVFVILLITQADGITVDTGVFITVIVSLILGYVVAAAKGAINLAYNKQPWGLRHIIYQSTGRRKKTKSKPWAERTVFGFMNQKEQQYKNWERESARRENERRENEKKAARCRERAEKYDQGSYGRNRAEYQARKYEEDARRGGRR